MSSHSHRAQGGLAVTDDGLAAARADGADGGPRRSRRARRFSLRAWRVRSRLLLLIAVPTIVALVLGILAIRSSLRSAQAYQHVQQLATLSGDITGLVQALQNERLDTVTFITMADQGGRASALSANQAQKAAAAPELMLLRSDYNATGQSAARVRSLAETIGGGYPALAQQQAQDVITAIDDLPELRQATVDTMLPALTVINYYGNTITQLLSLESQVAAGSNNASLADNVRVLSLISNMKEEAAQQQAIVTSALHSNLIGATRLTAESLSVLNQQAAGQAANLSAFDFVATAAQRQLYNSGLSSPLTAMAQQQLQQAITLLTSGFTSTGDPTVVVAADDASFTTSSLRSVEQQLMSSVIAQSGSLRARATAMAVMEAIGVLLLLGLALLLITVVGRSMTVPLLRLRTRALEIAGVRLPEAVRRMAETDGEGVPLEVEPIDVDSSDEIGEVARAFDQVHREALRLAANEAALRGNVNAMFVNLSRRSQSLVERQIRLIDDLEQGEQDPERLSSLFQMDHLATRMRRNSENLLVLAGHEEPRHWNHPVALVDVVRAALSEIERYDRVALDVQPGVAVSGQAVSDVVHLTAELVENATSFSAAETPVTIAGHLLKSGGVLLEIADQGVGMGAEEMAHANWRLDNPPVVDVGVSRRMGLFVVARLAARHGIRVRLRPAASGGLAALVWLPEEAITRESPDNPFGPYRPNPVVPVISTAAPLAGMFGVGIREASGRFAVEQELDAARTPRFASLRADAAEASPDPGPDTVPGPRPEADRMAAAPVPLFPDLKRGAEPDADLGGLAGGQGTASGDEHDAAGSPASVVVLPSDGSVEENRLPIFEAVESDWFRRERQAADRFGYAGEVSGVGWTSPADEGWRAAEVVRAPSSDGITDAGLPKRVPQANLVPGTVPQVAGPPSLARSAAKTRERFGSFQQGVVQGRAAAVDETEVPAGD